jgi:translation initiation factor IF-1
MKKGKTPNQTEDRAPREPKKGVIELEGIVEEALPGTQFRVKLPNGHTILAHVSGNIRRNFIRILPGDTVKIEMSPYDMTKGRIIYRGKQ